MRIQTSSDYHIVSTQALVVMHGAGQNQQYLPGFSFRRLPEHPGKTSGPDSGLR